MKKALILASMIVLLSSSMCFSEILNTALGNGEGNFDIQGFYISNSLAGTGSTQFGPKLIYGVTDDFDLTAKLGMGSYSSVSTSTMGLGGKYTILKIAKKDAIDLAGMVNYESFSINNVTLSMIYFGTVISKDVKKDVTLYGILGITNISYEYKDVALKVAYSASALTFGGGMKFKVNKDFSILGEFETFSADGSAFTTLAIAGQYALR